MAPQNVNRSDSDPVATQTQHSHPPARELAAKKQQKKTRFAANPTRTSNLPTFHQNSTHIAHFGIKLLHIQLPTGSGDHHPFLLTPLMTKNKAHQPNTLQPHDLNTHQTKLAYFKQQSINIQKQTKCKLNDAQGRGIDGYIPESVNLHSLSPPAPPKTLTIQPNQRSLTALGKPPPGRKPELGTQTPQNTAKHPPNSKHTPLFKLFSTYNQIKYKNNL